MTLSLFFFFFTCSESLTLRTLSFLPFFVLQTNSHCSSLHLVCLIPFSHGISLFRFRGKTKNITAPTVQTASISHYQTLALQPIKITKHVYSLLPVLRMALSPLHTYSGARFQRGYHPPCRGRRKKTPSAYSVPLALRSGEMMGYKVQPTLS